MSTLAVFRSLPRMTMQRRFRDLLEQGSAELFGDHLGAMESPTLLPTSNVIADSDLELFFRGVDAGLISLERGCRFNTLDRPKARGRWGLLSRSRHGGWYNAEYLPQLAAYIDAIDNLGYSERRVLFELPATAMQLDLAILDDAGAVVVLGEAKRAAEMLDDLRAQVEVRFASAPPSPESKHRGDEARQLAWRLWTVQPPFLWLIAPGKRVAYRCTLDPLRLVRIDGLPSAAVLHLDGSPAGMLEPPHLVAQGSY
jgi:hypothetical protein